MDEDTLLDTDLFADGGSFDIPADLKVGLTFKPSDALAFNFDIEQIWYSDIDSVANPIANIFACPTAGFGGMDLESCLCGKNGAGFGWDDMTVYKLGMMWTNNEDWTWRLGEAVVGQQSDVIAAIEAKAQRQSSRNITTITSTSAVTTPPGRPVRK